MDGFLDFTCSSGTCTSWWWHISTNVSSTYGSHRNGYSCVDPKVKFSNHSKYMWAIISNNSKPIVTHSQSLFQYISVLKQVRSTQKFNISINILVDIIMHSCRCLPLFSFLFWNADIYSISWEFSGQINHIYTHQLVGSKGNILDWFCEIGGILHIWADVFHKTSAKWMTCRNSTAHYTPTEYHSCET